MNKLLLALVTFVAAAVASIGIAFAAVDANTASQAELESIKGIGPAIAARIIDERKKGNFKDLKDLEERVKGIGEENVKKMSAAGLAVGKGGAPKAEAKPAEAKSEAPKAAAKPADAAKDAPKADAKPADMKKEAARADDKADAKAAAKAERAAAKAAKADAKAAAAGKGDAAKGDAAKADPKTAKAAAAAADKPVAASDKPAAKKEGEKK